MTLPPAIAGVWSRVNSDAVPRDAPPSDSFSEINSNGQPMVHNDASNEVHHTQQQQAEAEPLSVKPKRRGRPPKGSPAHQNKHNTSKAVTPRPPTGRRLSASSVHSAISVQSDDPSSNSEKKTRLRARNREAARKCRIRKQRGIEDLQTEEAAISAVNQSLKNQYAELRSEVVLLKDMVLQHGGCGCSFIESYIEDAAASLTQRSDSFTTSRHGSSSSGISPAASWSPASPQRPGPPGLAPLEDGTSSASTAAQFDWDTMGGFINYHESGQMFDLSTTFNGDYQRLENLLAG